VCLSQDGPVPHSIVELGFLTIVQIKAKSWKVWKLGLFLLYIRDSILIRVSFYNFCDLENLANFSTTLAKLVKFRIGKQKISKICPNCFVEKAANFVFKKITDSSQWFYLILSCTYSIISENPKKDFKLCPNSKKLTEKTAPPH